ncbi:alpha/beta hydrolase [Nocardia farcinica]|uniref:alpha/beta hydrolase n=1 Tax=Nocardia farcinica TaxID=37329 RepID=UPI001E3FAE0C|nr:alpha/beta hydrolase [Nocardia farcinica]
MNADLTDQPRTSSRRARALRTVSALTVGRLAATAPVTPQTLWAARPVVDRLLRATAPVLPGTTATLIEEGPVRGEWVVGPRQVRGGGVILYIHGGGFLVGSPRAYRGIAARLSAAARTPVFTVGYRLAPEHPFPAARTDILAAYRWLIGRGWSPDRIAIAGDSAGGYLAAQLTLELARRGEAPPAALLLFSPLADPSLQTLAGRAPATTDGLLSVALLRAALDLCGHTCGEDSRLSVPTGVPLPPALIHAGVAELLADDARELARRWRGGAPCTLRMWPDQLHVFHVLPVLVPESRMVYRESGRFLADRYAARTAEAG